MIRDLRRGRATSKLPAGRRRCLTALTAFGVLSLAACNAAWAASDAEVAEMRRLLQELQAQNRELMRRLNTLEAEIEQQRRGAAPQRRPGPAPAPETSPFASAPRAPAPQGAPAATEARRVPTTEELERRVRELELARAAQESATRSIIRDALTSLGSNINQYVALGGAIEARAGRAKDFTGGPWRSAVELTTAEFDFDIKMSDWLFGSLIVSYAPGSVLFQTTEGFGQPVDRINLDRAVITVGDPQLFPIYARGGRDVLQFGTSTGIARLDTLSLAGPLTTDAFEIRETFVEIGFAFPTPELGPLPPPVVIPPVRPLVINPLVVSAADAMGYRQPPTRVPPLVAVRPPPFPPPFYGSIGTFHGDRNLAAGRGVTQNINASLGVFQRGTCGRNYEDLRGSWLCPWTVDFHVDYVSSVFDSGFLRAGYRPFLPTIGQVPGLAAALKASFGPFNLVGEYNTAIRSAVFTDDSGRVVRLQPAAWQVSLAYQFDWNPWVEKVGEQGNYVAVTYSGTNDLAGVVALLNGVPTQVGFLPRSRLALTAGEWVLPNLRLAAELSYDWDYSRQDGGTGKTGIGFFLSALLTF